MTSPHRAIKGLGTTSSPEFQVLQELHRTGTIMTENQLAVETGLSRGAVKTGTRRLLEKGLVSTWTQGNQIPVYIISELGQEHFETVTGEYQ